MIGPKKVILTVVENVAILLSVKFYLIPISYIHTRQPTNPRPILWLGRVWSGKTTYSLWLKSVSIPDQRRLYPWCTHAQIPLFPTYPRCSGWPIPVLHDQTPTYSWYNYAHYAQYRTNPPSDFYSQPQMNNSISVRAQCLFYIDRKWTYFTFV